MLSAAQTQTIITKPAVFIPDTNTTIAVRFSPSSQDISLYIESPDFFQYTAIGLGGTLMSDSLMLVFYPSSSSSSSQPITISPRTGNSDTEPLFTPGFNFTLHPNSGLVDSVMIINATCHNCRTFASGSVVTSQQTQTILFANGPGGLDLATDDASASIRRHVAYGSFVVDTRSTTGDGPVFESTIRNASNTALLDQEGAVKTSSNKLALAHGVLFVVIILAIGPFDGLIALAFPNWPILQAVSSSIYVAFVIGAFVPGVLISRIYVATQQLRTPHQALGLLTVILVFLMYILGAGLGFIKRSAAKRGQAPPERAILLSNIHKWGSRAVWVLLVISGGLGLKLADRNTIFIIGYGVLVGGVFIFLLPVVFCIWWCRRQRKDKEGDEGLELHERIYNQMQGQGHHGGEQRYGEHYGEQRY
ncbi:hypothetical protein QBC47DRAFT_294101 [Echria macrotheca]|uniref:Cellobiose dehydrogenase-like cytochrome domain-containing protein n=1 Tax=Echria macrotheca TaxID=438768 RepID=A0AAJ0BJ93_9PEZI|nr:hypothetical protein QBC47DRAFT_294101 [Echria macrotheca]